MPSFAQTIYFKFLNLKEPDSPSTILLDCSQKFLGGSKVGRSVTGRASVSNCGTHTRVISTDSFTFPSVYKRGVGRIYSLSKEPDRRSVPRPLRVLPPP